MEKKPMTDRYDSTACIDALVALGQPHLDEIELREDGREDDPDSRPMRFAARTAVLIRADRAVLATAIDRMAAECGAVIIADAIVAPVRSSRALRTLDDPAKGSVG
jgi:hypothetical protein